MTIPKAGDSAYHAPCVYFARANANQFIKIGQTASLPERTRTLAKKHAGFAVFAVIEGDYKKEHEIQERFQKHRVNMDAETEWFYPSRRLEEFIKHNGLPYQEGVYRPDFLENSWEETATFNLILRPSIHKMIRRKALRDTCPVSTAAAELLCRGAGVDPAEFGVRQRTYKTP